MKGEVLLNLFLPRTRGACVAHFRNLLQLTQDTISKDLGMNRSSISKMENGDINVSDNVWNHVLNLIYLDFELGKSIPFEEFQASLERFIEDEEKVSRRQVEWRDEKLSWALETNI